MADYYEDERGAGWGPGWSQGLAQQGALNILPAALGGLAGQAVSMAPSAAISGTTGAALGSAPEVIGGSAASSGGISALFGKIAPFMAAHPVLTALGLTLAGAGIGGLFGGNKGPAPSGNPPPQVPFSGSPSFAGFNPETNAKDEEFSFYEPMDYGTQYFADGGMVPHPLQKDMGPNRGQIDPMSPPDAGSGPSNKQLIQAAMQAIQGQMENPQQVLMMFVQRFGQEALKDLAGRVRGTDSPEPSGRMISGPGGPTDDAIPALIDNQQPARLSSGEYVVPANKVQENGGPSGIEQLLNLQA